MVCLTEQFIDGREYFAISHSDLVQCKNKTAEGLSMRFFLMAKDLSVLVASILSYAY